MAPSRPQWLIVIGLLLALVVAGTPASARGRSTSPPDDPTRSSVLGSVARANWVVDENSKPGTTAWRIPSSAPRGIEGYANRVSVQVGGRVALYVSTDAPTFQVKAYRLGYYQGLGGRLIWKSSRVPGVVQAPAEIDPSTNMVDAPWQQSISFPITSTWPQGCYLLKLVASSGAQSYVPLTVRDDSSTAALVIQNEVTTWQAYNSWGGYSLYAGEEGGFATRSRVVSFDRPYGFFRGAAGLLDGNEQPVIALVERLGLDITYWTDVDLDERPGLLRHHRALISLGHDEYWSSAMRQAALDARHLYGVNIAFLGSNADFRHVRFESSPLGADRRIVCYKVGTEDPLYGIDDAEVTVNWRDPPVPRPESVLNGDIYDCHDVLADMVVVDPSSWLFTGTGLADGDRLSLLVRGEYDHVNRFVPTPGNIELLAHSPVVCRGRNAYSDVTYYTTSSGAGVFDSGTTGWIGALKCAPPVKRRSCDLNVVTITENLLAGFSAGPAGVAHPSSSNLDRFGIVLRYPISV
jgi:hypothetical protein